MFTFLNRKALCQHAKLSIIRLFILDVVPCAHSEVPCFDPHFLSLSLLPGGRTDTFFVAVRDFNRSVGQKGVSVEKTITCCDSKFRVPI